MNDGATAGSFILTVLIFGVKGEELLLKKYEDLVIPILHKYGIEILLRVHLANSTFSFADKEKPSEVLVLSVPSQEAMNAYFKDPHRLALKEKYGHVIKQIKMFRGKEA